MSRRDCNGSLFEQPQSDSRFALLDDLDLKNQKNKEKYFPIYETNLYKNEKAVKTNSYVSV